jgi:endonuclease/exonuclease/phosphatase (EEP) superfamily protein YafD
MFTIHLVAPQRSGWLALSQVLAPFIFLPLILVLPFAIINNTHLLRALLLACIACAIFSFFPPLNFIAPTQTSTSTQLKVLQWNVNVCCGSERQAARVRPVLETSNADIIVLQEAYWQWMREDPTISRRYPYQLNHTSQASSGLVVLSRFPIMEGAGAPQRPGTRGWPRIVWARLDLGSQRELLLVAAHTESPYSSNGRCRFPSCYDTTERDSLLPNIRALVDPALAQQKHILLIGDMNTTEREPAYDELVRGLADTHREIGKGFGNTWGLIPELGWTIPLLRIEYLFHSSNIAPMSMVTDCTLHGSDHCSIEGTFTLK